MFFFGLNLLRGMFGIILFPLAIWAAIWTYRDASRMENRYQWIWAGISFSIFPVGFVIYLIYRMFVRNRV